MLSLNGKIFSHTQTRDLVHGRNYVIRHLIGCKEVNPGLYKWREERGGEMWWNAGVRIGLKDK